MSDGEGLHVEAHDSARGEKQDGKRSGEWRGKLNSSARSAERRVPVGVLAHLVVLDDDVHVVVQHVVAGRLGVACSEERRKVDGERLACVRLRRDRRTLHCSPMG